MTPIKLREEPSWISIYNDQNEVKDYWSNVIKKQEEITCSRLINNRDKALEELVRERLYKLDYKFTNDENFYSFVKNRITRICDSNDRETEYLYLDYVSEEEKGILLVTFSSKIEYNFDNLSGKMTMSIG